MKNGAKKETITDNNNNNNNTGHNKNYLIEKSPMVFISGRIRITMKDQEFVRNDQRSVKTTW